MMPCDHDTLMHQTTAVHSSRNHPMLSTKQTAARFSGGCFGISYDTSSAMQDVCAPEHGMLEVRVAWA